MFFHGYDVTELEHQMFLKYKQKINYCSTNLNDKHKTKLLN